MVVSSTQIVHLDQVERWGILEAATNKGAFENVFVVSTDRLFGGATAGDEATASAKSVEHFDNMDALLSSGCYKNTVGAFPEDIWNRETLTFKSSNAYFTEEVNAVPESVELSIDKAETLVTNFGAYVITTNSDKVKVENGAILVTEAVLPSENAWLKITCGKTTKTVAISTKAETTVDMTYNMNAANQGDLVISGLPLNLAKVTVYVRSVDGDEIALDATCVNGTLKIAAATLKAKSGIATGIQPLRINYSGDYNYYMQGVTFVWVINN